MQDSADDIVWLACPNCRSRVAYRPGQGLKELRCSNCSSLVGKPESALPGKAKRARKSEGPWLDLQPGAEEREEEGELRLASAEPRPTAQDGGLENWGSGGYVALEPRNDGELEGRPLAHHIASYRDSEPKSSYPPSRPPKFAFFSGVFTYPWRPRSLTPWLVISLGSMMTGGIATVILGGVQSGTPAGGVVAGIVGLAELWLSALVYSYAAAAFFSVVEMTTYNYDPETDWPEGDWRERLWYLLWMIWLGAIASVIAIGPSALVAKGVADAGPVAVWLIHAGIVAALMPFLILSSLEANSPLVPVSGEIFRSLGEEFTAWIVYYLAAGAVAVGWVILTWRLFLWQPYLSLMITMPAFAAAVLIEGRLLGRLAWKIMRKTELELAEWRKTREFRSAAENVADALPD